MTIVALISSVVVIVLVVGFAVFRYYLLSGRSFFKSSSSDSSYSIVRYWRRQLPSNSFDNNCISTSDQVGLHPTNDDVNETSRIIKSSFSWPEATLLHYKQQDNQQNTNESLSSLSNSSTFEQFSEPASLTFSLRWIKQTNSLFIRVINARNLVFTRRYHSSNLLDSYIRIELMSTDDEGN